MNDSEIDALFDELYSPPPPPNLTDEERQKLIEGNYGRDYGWYLLSAEGERIGELVDCENAEMFWDSYVVKPYDGRTEMLTDEFWYALHRVQNREVPSLVIDIIGGGFDTETNRAGVRAGYWHDDSALPVEREGLLSLLKRFWSWIRG